MSSTTNHSKRYSPEVKQRAIRMVFEHAGSYPSEWAAISSIASKLGMSAETLRSWIRSEQVDAGKRPGITSRNLSTQMRHFFSEIREQPPRSWAC
jgi:transposase